MINFIKKALSNKKDNTRKQIEFKSQLLKDELAEKRRDHMAALIFHDSGYRIDD